MRGPENLKKKSSLPQVGDNLNWGQKYANSVRPQLPRDYSQNGYPRWSPGEMPTGGYRSVFDFSTGPVSTKLNPTTRGRGPRIIGNGK